GEVTSRIVNLDLVLASPTWRQRSLHEDAESGTARRHLRVGLEIVDDLVRPRFDDAGFRIATFVEIHADEGIARSEDEADADKPGAVVHRREGALKVVPAVGICDARK